MSGPCNWGDTLVEPGEASAAVMAGFLKVRELPASLEVVANLVAYSSIEDPHVAFHAVRRLGELGPAAGDAIPALLAGLRRLTAAGGPNRSAHALPSPPYGWALSQIGPGNWEVLLGLLEAGPAQRMGFAGHDVRSWREKSENGNDLLRRATMESSLPTAQRRMALLALASAHDAGLVSSLQELAEEPDLRAAAFEYAMRANGEVFGAFPALVDFGVSQARKDVERTRLLFDRLANSGEADNPPLIRKLLRQVYDPRHPFSTSWNGTESQPVASMALSALIGISKHAVVELVGPYADDPDADVRCGVATACWSKVGEGDWATRFLSHLSATNEVERTAFAATLIWVPRYRPEAEFTLIRSATSTSLTNICRKLAMTALSLNAQGNGITPAVREGLEQCALDPDSMVREAARRILERSTPSRRRVAPSALGATSSACSSCE